MKTLLRKGKVSERWYPQPVETLKNAILFESEKKKLYQSNFAYSMQYLEYIDKQLSDLKLTNVLLTMLYKSYIITGVSIIECIFTDILKSHGKWNTTEWQEIEKLTSNHKIFKDFDNQVVKAEVHLFKQVDEYEMTMDFDSILKKMEKSHFLSLEHHDFPMMKHLRRLRNRVHLQAGENDYDHDYNSFNLDDYLLMKEILYRVLTCSEICLNASCFEFLRKK